MKSVRIFNGSVAVLGVSACLLFAGSASASPISVSVFVQSVTANPGDTGDEFELTVTNTGGSDVTIGGFGFGVSLSDPDVTLTDATDTTALNPYLFQGNSLFGPDILASTDEASLFASDIDADFGSGVTLNPGDSYGLGQVYFNVAADALPGVYAITLSEDPAATDFSDASGENSIPILAFNSGQITVADSSAPEPSTWLLFGAALATLQLGRSRRNRLRQ
jgi:hypothetical protein